MDPLAEVLRDLRLSGSFFAHTNARAPWGLAFLVADGPAFHVIVSGQCCLRLGNERVTLTAGDLVVLPRGEDHQLADPADSTAIHLVGLPSTEIGDNVALCQLDGSGAQSILICGRVDF